MKGIHTLLLVLSMLAAEGRSIGAQGGEPLGLRVMTFNIRTGRAKDGDNAWRHRKDFVADVISNYSPDVLGLQEAWRFQLDELSKRLPEYHEVGCGRKGGSDGEYSAILFQKKRFDLRDSGTFWLSDTPDKPSKHWGNRFERVCTWAHLEDRESKRSFYVYNVHLDHQSQPSREKGVELIMKYIKRRAHPDPFILTGDFNAGEQNPAIRYLKGTGTLSDRAPVAMVDSFRVLHPDKKVVGTGNGFRGRTKGNKIDYIFVTPETQVLEATINRVNRKGRYPSDHYSVTARLQIQ